MTERREPSNTAEQQQEKGLLAHQMYWHECVQQLDGENSEPNEHNSMTLQFGTRRSRSQAAVVMCINCAAEQIQHFSKTIYLETHHESTHLPRSYKEREITSPVTHTQAQVGSIKTFVSRHEHNNHYFIPDITHNRLTALVRDYPGEPVQER